jgi:hypothetical protein
MTRRNRGVLPIKNLPYQNDEKSLATLIIANKELTHQNSEKKNH